jgi:hypothetical protein
MNTNMMMVCQNHCWENLMTLNSENRNPFEAAALFQVQMCPAQSHLQRKHVLRFWRKIGKHGHLDNLVCQREEFEKEEFNAICLQLLEVVESNSQRRWACLWILLRNTSFDFLN